MPESTIYPQTLEIDVIKNGVARILTHWNIETVLREDVIIYTYDEAVINWALPDTFEYAGGTIKIATHEDVENYIAANSEEIMLFAIATQKVII